MATTRTVPSSLPAVSRRSLLQFGTAGLALGALAACSSPGGGSGRKITFVFYGNATGQKAVAAQYAGFVKANPKIDFVPQGIPAKSWADFANTVSTRIAGGSAPDVIDIATEGLGIFRSKKLVTPLDSYIKKSQSTIDEYYADIDPTYKKFSDKYGNPGNTTYYMPGGFNTVCMYANTEVFAKAGVDLPGTDDWTWDDFKAAGEKFKKQGAYILPFGSSQFVDIMPWLFSNGASTFDEDWKQVTIDTDAALEAVEFAKEMIDRGYSPKPGGTFDAPTQLAKGKLAMMGGGRWVTLDMIRLKIVDKVQIIKTPKKVRNGTPIGWDTYPILASSKAKDDAWKFIEYMTTKEAAINFAKVGGGNIPARQSVALDDVFLKGAPKGSELLYQAASYATAIPSPDRGAEIANAIEETWLRILTGSVKAKPGLSQLADKLNGLL